MPRGTYSTKTWSEEAAKTAERRKQIKVHLAAGKSSDLDRYCAIMGRNRSEVSELIVLIGAKKVRDQLNARAAREAASRASEFDSGKRGGDIDHGIFGHTLFGDSNEIADIRREVEENRIKEAARQAERSRMKSQEFKEEANEAWLAVLAKKWHKILHEKDGWSEESVKQEG